LIALFSTPAGAEQPSKTFQMIHTGAGLSLHKEMFMMPATYSDEYHNAQTEAVFQLSAKHRLFGTRFYFAYTQISFWQAYDYKNSSPFRETDYNPELFYRAKPHPFHAGQLGADVGFEHESNGQKPPLSRSWNLLYISPYYARSNVLLYLKLRYRIPEDEKEFPEAAVGDDNPDITDYLGYSDVRAYYQFRRDHLIQLMLRGNLGTGKGNVSLTYSFPIPNSEMSFLGFRVSHGYGESLVDYKKSITRIGVGVMFNR
jgi:phospholipase A1